MRRGNNKKVGTYYLMAVQQESLSRARGTRKFFQSVRPFHVLHNIVENRRDLLFSVDSRYKLSTLWVEKRTKNKCRNFDHDAIMARLSATELSVHTFPKKNLHENYKLYYVGRRTRLWENAVNNSHFEKIISNTDVTRQMLQFQLFIPRKIFCWQQHNSGRLRKLTIRQFRLQKPEM